MKRSRCKPDFDPAHTHRTHTMPKVDFTQFDNMIRRMDFHSQVPSIRRAKALYMRDGDLEEFEREVEAALRLDQVCTVCGRTSTNQDGRCNDHLGSSLAGDWPTESNLQTIQKMKSI